MLLSGMLLSELGMALCAAQASSDSGFDKNAWPFLERHCFRCHGEERQKGNFRIDSLSQDFANGPSIDHWLDVIEKLSSDEMPPEGQVDRPTAEQSARIVAWLSARIKAGEAARLAKRERVSLHRLTREEYANTIYDLLGVNFDVGDSAGLNEDDQWHGFERIGSVLSLSASHVEKYLAAAEVILAEAYPEMPPEPFVVRESALDLVGGADRFGAEKYDQFSQSGLADKVRVDLWPGQQVTAKPDRGRFQWSGQYRIRAQVSGLKPPGGRTPHLAIYAESIDRLLFEQDVFAPEGEPVIVEFETHLPAGNHEFTLINEVPGPSILPRLGRSNSKPFFSLKEGRIPWQVPLKDDDDTPLYPVLILDWIELEGPILAEVDRELDREPNHERDSYMPESGAGLEQADSSLRRLAERAFRRPLQPGEMDRYDEFIRDQLTEGKDLRSAVKASMLAVLCSNQFLYLVEGSPGDDRARLEDWELASRLSYFLWSTMPDQELLGLARNDKLHLPQVLRSQVARMLADPRAKRLAQSFSRQWLQLNRVGMFTPDGELYPDYDKYLERSMVRETTEFFAEVLENNLTIREFLAADWTMANPRLALHYGIPGVTEDRFQRVKLAPDQHRGGILTQASVLSLTSDGTRHRPVHRGVWVSESIFGESPPPPPATVEPIEPNPIDAQRASIRMQLDAHRKDPSCAACHRKIDPLGFAFDNYDAIGRWRTEEVVPMGVGSNPRVDASGSLPDGRSFSNASEFQQLLLEDIDRFNAAFVKKLATYALRRTMGVDDRDDLEAIARRSKASDYRLRDVVEAVVLSDLFKQR